MRIALSTCVNSLELKLTFCAFVSDLLLVHYASLNTVSLCHLNLCGTRMMHLSLRIPSILLNNEVRYQSSYLELFFLSHIRALRSRCVHLNIYQRDTLGCLHASEYVLIAEVEYLNLYCDLAFDLSSEYGLPVGD